MNKKTVESLKSEFYAKFTRKSTRHFFAPGRVNLIGEHTDYNGGYVFPCALSFGTDLLVALRADDKIRAFSLNFESDGIIESSVNDIVHDEKNGWLNYVLGIVDILQIYGCDIHTGFDLLVYGEIPTGAGLSSSASLELATAYMINECYDLGLTRLEMVKFSQEAENHFNGVQCGIMDQFVIGMAIDKHAILLDCNTLKYENVKVSFGEYKLVIVNTNKSRGLVDSLYNKRRESCAKAFAELNSSGEYSCLSDIQPSKFESIKTRITNDEDRKRATHVIYENARTIAAAKALVDNDMKAFGKWMYQSHMSLKDIYEVTGVELDCIVELSKEFGAIGARMTGAGFGGCAIALIHYDKVEEYKKYMTDKYKEKIGYEPSIYLCEISGGVKEVEE